MKNCLSRTKSLRNGSMVTLRHFCGAELQQVESFDINDLRVEEWREKWEESPQSLMPSASEASHRPGKFWKVWEVQDRPVALCRRNGELDAPLVEADRARGLDDGGPGVVGQWHAFAEALGAHAGLGLAGHQDLAARQGG